MNEEIKLAGYCHRARVGMWRRGGPEDSMSISGKDPLGGKPKLLEFSVEVPRDFWKQNSEWVGADLEIIVRLKGKKEERTHETEANHT